MKTKIKAKKQKINKILRASKQRKLNQNVCKIKLSSFFVAQPCVGMDSVLECGW